MTLLRSHGSFISQSVMAMRIRPAMTTGNFAKLARLSKFHDFLTTLIADRPWSSFSGPWPNNSIVLKLFNFVRYHGQFHSLHFVDLLSWVRKRITSILSLSDTSMPESPPRPVTSSTSAVVSTRGSSLLSRRRPSSLVRAHSSTPSSWTT